MWWSIKLHELGGRIGWRRDGFIQAKPSQPSKKNQIGGLTDNPPISLAHSMLPEEGKAKMETQ